MTATMSELINTFPKSQNFLVWGWLNFFFQKLALRSSIVQWLLVSCMLRIYFQEKLMCVTEENWRTREQISGSKDGRRGKGEGKGGRRSSSEGRSD